MQGYSEDDIKNAAELREWLTKLILEKQEEVDKLKITLALIDSVLKQGSFKTAANLNLNRKSNTEKNYLDLNKRKDSNLKTNNTNIEKNQAIEKRQIKRIKNNAIIADVEISNDEIDIIPLESISFNIEISPFKAFFINRIVEGMKNKDLEKVNQGVIKESEIIQYDLILKENSENILQRIKIYNYREKERVNEIFNTVAWVFIRMLEKSEK